MKTINFNGIQGEVLAQSGHGNYIVLALSDNVSVCATRTNKWNWEETNDSQFKAFITYIGCQDYQQARLIYEWAVENGCEFDLGKHEHEPRPSKRIRDTNRYPLELKIRGLSAKLVTTFVN